MSERRPKAACMNDRINFARIIDEANEADLAKAMRAACREWVSGDLPNTGFPWAFVSGYLSGSADRRARPAAAPKAVQGSEGM